MLYSIPLRRVSFAELSGITSRSKTVISLSCVIEDDTHAGYNKPNMTGLDLILSLPKEYQTKIVKFLSSPYVGKLAVIGGKLYEITRL